MVPRDHGNVGAFHNYFRLGLRPHFPDSVSRRPDENHIIRITSVGKISIFRQKAKSRMDPVAVVVPSNLKYFVAV